MLGIFLDSEANGLNPQVHRLLEIAFQIVELDSGNRKESYHSIVFQSMEIWAKSDPQSLKINGFTQQLLETGKKEQLVKEEILSSFRKCNIDRTNAVFICQNPSFDRAFFSQLIDIDLQEKLFWPYHWLDLASMFWSLQIHRATEEQQPFPWEIGLSKDQIASFLHMSKEPLPHRAMNGVEHLLACYREVVGFPMALKREKRSLL